MKKEEVYINKDFPCVIVGKKEMFFTPREYDLFMFLWEHRNLTCTRKMMIEKVYHFYSGSDTRVIDVYIGYIRRKLSETILSEAIKSLRPWGYRLVYEPEERADECSCSCINCQNCIAKTNYQADKAAYI